MWCIYMYLLQTNLNVTWRTKVWVNFNDQASQQSGSPGWLCWLHRGNDWETLNKKLILDDRMSMDLQNHFKSAAAKFTNHKNDEKRSMESCWCFSIFILWLHPSLIDSGLFKCSLEQDFEVRSLTPWYLSRPKKLWTKNGSWNFKPGLLNSPKNNADHWNHAGVFSISICAGFPLNMQKPVDLETTDWIVVPSAGVPNPTKHTKTYKLCSLKTFDNELLVHDRSPPKKKQTPKNQIPKSKPQNPRSRIPSTWGIFRTSSKTLIHNQGDYHVQEETWKTTKGLESWNRRGLQS